MKQLQKPELIDTLFNDSAEGIIVVDVKGNISFSKLAIAKMSNYSTSELESLNVNNIKYLIWFDQSIDNIETTSIAFSNTRTMGMGIDLFCPKAENYFQ